MAQIKFVQLSQTKYNEFASNNSLSASSIYFTSDTRRIYKGDALYSNDIQYLTTAPTDASALVEDKLYVVTSTGDMYVKQNGLIKQVGGNSAKVSEIQSNITNLSSSLDALEQKQQNDLSSLSSTLTDAINDLSSEHSSDIAALSNSKLDVSLFEAYSSTTSATLSSLDSQIDTVASNSSVTMSSADGTDNVLKVYTFTQGGRQIGKVNIPKDLVVTSGSVVKGTWSGQTFTEDPTTTGIGKALKLTIANQADPVYINTLDLVKDHTGSTVAGITVTISDTNVISVSIADGTIASSTLAADVQSSLAKADTALQSGATYYTDIKVAANGDTLATDMNGVKGRIDALEAFQSSSSADVDNQIDAKIAELDSSATAATGKFINSIQIVNGKISAIGEGQYTLSSGSANGTVSFNGTDVAVTGLGSAAYTESSAYDAAGSASQVQNTLTGTAQDSITTLTLYGLKNYIDSVSSSNTEAHTSLSNDISSLESNISDSMSTLSSSLTSSFTASLTSALAWQEIAD